MTQLRNLRTKLGKSGRLLRLEADASDGTYEVIPRTGEPQLIQADSLEEVIKEATHSYKQLGVFVGGYTSRTAHGTYFDGSPKDDDHEVRTYAVQTYELRKKVS